MQQLPSIEFIFHNSHATLAVQFVLRLLTMSPYSSSTKQGFLRNPLILSFKQVLASYFVSCVQRSKDGIGNYIFVQC
jgi:hypothetical protein